MRSYRVGVAKLLSHSGLGGRAARVASLPVVFGLCLIGGLVLGAVDLAAQKILPYPWANLANSSAVSALGAFAVGYWLRLPIRRAAASGVVVLVVAVASYYLAATPGAC